MCTWRKAHLLTREHRTTEMPIENFFAIFLTMFVLALAPGPAMLAVISRSITSGARQGIYMSIGIVLADYIFISIALLGLSMAFSTFEPLFEVKKKLGSSYLLFFGVQVSTKDSSRRIVSERCNGIITLKPFSRTVYNSWQSKSDSFLCKRISRFARPKGNRN